MQMPYQTLSREEVIAKVCRLATIRSFSTQRHKVHDEYLNLILRSLVSSCLRVENGYLEFRLLEFFNRCNAFIDSLKASGAK